MGASTSGRSSGTLDKSLSAVDVMIGDTQVPPSLLKDARYYYYIFGNGLHSLESQSKTQVSDKFKVQENSYRIVSLGHREHHQWKKSALRGLLTSLELRPALHFERISSRHIESISRFDHNSSSDFYN